MDLITFIGVMAGVVAIVGFAYFLIFGQKSLVELWQAWQEWTARKKTSPSQEQPARPVASVEPKSTPPSSSAMQSEEQTFSDGQPVAVSETLVEPRSSYDPQPSLEIPLGVVRPNSPFYIERPADEQLRRQVLGAGTLTTIRAGRQAGKTSLLMRGVQIAKQDKRPVAYLDFQTVEAEYRKTLESLLRHLADKIAYQLKIESHRIGDTWQSSSGAPDKFSRFLEIEVLEQAKAPILLAIDEADQLLDAPYKTDFFGLVRAWDSLRAYDERWAKLNVAMVISTHPFLLIENTNQSPFNVGLRIELQDFTEAQVSDLNHRHGDPVASEEMPAMMDLLGGHPYLVRQALYTLVDQKLTWDELAKAAVGQQGPFGQHLRFYRNELKQRPELVRAMQQVIAQRRPIEEKALYRLVAAGLVKEVENNYVCRCGLYEAYFREKL